MKQKRYILTVIGDDMRLIRSVFLLCLTFFLISADRPRRLSYKARNPELGIVYTPASWDRKQWEEVFNDPATPVGWAFMPIGGTGGCSGLARWWLSGSRQRGLRLGILLDPFLTEEQIKKTIDCALPLGVKRIVLDEYISYHTTTNHKPLCTVISELRSIYEYTKTKDSTVQFGYDDNWQTWIPKLSRDQTNACGKYPYFQVDFAGISVLSKYSNPSQGVCGHPTVAEMREQLIDLQPTVKDYSKTGKIFVWQLNQHWYPGGADVLQLFREMKRVYGWQRFLLFGPTADNTQSGNWGYTEKSNRDGCLSSGYQWYLPARDYLIRISEGQKTSIDLQAPTSAAVGSVVGLEGRIRADIGISVKNIQLQIRPPVDSVQTFSREITAPSKARLALLGVRVNSQIPKDIRGAAQFRLDRVRLSETGSTKNLVSNGDFNDGLSDWIVLTTTQVTPVSTGSEQGVQATCSPNQLISLTSTPVFVKPGRSYVVEFDAALIREARNNGYFFVSWMTTSEIRRDRFFMNFPVAHTVATTSSESNGDFRFDWQPTNRGLYTISFFFSGSHRFQPAFTPQQIAVN